MMQVHVTRTIYRGGSGRIQRRCHRHSGKGRSERRLRHSGTPRGSEAVVQFLGISMQEEQDFVMIIVPKERNPISCRKSAPSAGFSPKHTVSSFPFRKDEVLGIHEEQ